jgi:hypothetical protein
MLQQQAACLQCSPCPLSLAKHPVWLARTLQQLTSSAASSTSA